IVILVCAIARSPATSIDEPPRKCRMLTPLFQPSRLTSMKRSAGPWNQVAIIVPSECQTLRKRSQSPASRHTTQFSTTSRMRSRSIIAESICVSPLHKSVRAELVEARMNNEGSAVAPFDLAQHRLRQAQGERQL